MYVDVCMCLHTRVHFCVYVYGVYVCICACMCVCIYAYVQRNAGVGVSHSVVSDSLEPHGALQAPLCMGFSGKNTGVGCHSHA